VCNGGGRLRTVARNEIVDKLNVTINAIIAAPTFKKCRSGQRSGQHPRFQIRRSPPVGSSPPRKCVIKLAGIKPE
jgi:hypothetical protein